jgi:Ser/Thr protein kinase RdoA (MazF antagonist)
MDEHRALQILTEAYEQRSSARLSLLNGYYAEDESPLYLMYRIILSPKRSLLFFAYHNAFTSWSTFTWSSAQTLDAWLQQRVALLSFLEEQDYLAPRVIRDTTGSGIHRAGPWNVLVTTYIEGQANVLTEESTSQLAGTLGRLHTLPPQSFQTLGVSWWNTATLTHALRQLQAISVSVPSSYQQLYKDIYDNVCTIQKHLSLLPEVIIHGDCWHPNGVQMEDSQVILIDWEYAGRGTAILDLGAFLLKCQCDEHGGFPPALNEKRIAAVAQGYTPWRALIAPEWTLLPEAICFSVCWRGGWLFSRLLQEGWTSQLERSIQRTQHAYALAVQTAHLAPALFEHS